MQEMTALGVLAYRRQDVRFGCRCCGQTRLESIEGLVDRFGPLFPFAKLADYSYCQKCGSIAMAVALG